MAAGLQGHRGPTLECVNGTHSIEHCLHMRDWLTSHDLYYVVNVNAFCVQYSGASIIAEHHAIDFYWTKL